MLGKGSFEIKLSPLLSLGVVYFTNLMLKG